VNDAIEAAHRGGLLSSASLMVGEPDAADAVARARRLPGLKVGLHVVLIEGTPVSPPDEIPDLVDSRGRFPSDMVMSGFRFFFRPKVRRQLAREIRAQFDAFARTGLALDHANTHKHIHLHPTVAALIIRIGREFGLKAMRLPAEPSAPIAAAEPRDGSWRNGMTALGDTALRLWTRTLRRRFTRAGIVANDHVFGLAWSGAMTEDRLLRLIPHLPEGVSEIYFHPARELTPRLAATMPTYRHAEELQALLSPHVGRALAAAGIARTTFTNLSAGTA
jgi:hopanoid biosynthesis associated protein HpnK